MTISSNSKVNIIGLILALALILAGVASQAQSSNPLIIGYNMDVTNSTLTAKTQGISDSVKLSITIGNAATALANQIDAKATNALNTANGAQSTATSALNIGNNAAVVNTAQTKTEDSLRDRIKVLEQGIPIIVGPVTPNTQTSNYTALQSDAGGCIVMNTKNTAVTLPALTPGTTFTIRNTSTGTISIKNGSVIVRTITTGAMYRTVYYITSTTIDVR